MSLLSINNIKKNAESQIAGFGKYKFRNFNLEKKKLQFQRLKDTNIVINKKRLPLNIMSKNCLLFDNDSRELQLNIKFYNLSLTDVLLKKTLIKTIQKNYKAKAVKQVWIEKKNNSECRPLKIFTLCDRILQKII